MPELPEVEVVRRGLASWVVGSSIGAAAVLHARAIRRHLAGAADFEGRLRERKILDVRRRGKYLWLPLDSADVLVGHLGMSGQLLLQPPGTADETHLRVRLHLSANAGEARELRFVDQRTFGGLYLDESGAGDVPGSIVHIAPDVLDENFDEDAFIARLRGKRTEVKRALLDQTLISGVGNIYADEALWRAELHFAHPTHRVSVMAARRLVAGVREVFAAALTAGGTSFDALYVNVNGQSGYFDRSLHAYGQEGRACARCGTAITRVPFMNRSSYFCPRCQRRPRAS